MSGPSLGPGSRVVLIGDSITDAGRLAEGEFGLGHGYAARVAGVCGRRGVTVLNRGVGGHRVVDLQARWDQDVLALEPDLVSIKIGINDTWRRYDAGDETSAEDFEAGYRDLLDRTLAGAPQAALVLVEPFLVPVRPEQWGWREDLDPKIQVVRRLAGSYGLPLVATDGPFAQAVTTSGLGPQAWAYDGVHPTPAGHDLLAEAWLKVVHLR
ncbi:SGNH/GDSL hydrolase family protein [Oerskovia enterophila]|uniref:GDSL-like lipase/acylhydrolase n=1 Tax=Oerskovia enterophila TaxID=43678 RepID=A0A163RJK1_9CELL|nr:SGNH/GDSL hydrolase family protein [Oerskovia enterophila]KZM35271.1 GDSL-like lipase/acylhydrolase [Oerskovia enterophila]OCI30420.1 GDSL-like lipase/acylhydrolase [Oerskovia enterophila]